jgi:two-component system, sensor histidine kinase and response regulator
MSAHQRLRLVLSGVAVAALLAVGWCVVTRGLDQLSGWPLAVHTGAKWILLGATVWLSFRNATAMDTGRPIGHAWLMFGLGIGAFLLGELGEAFYQFALGILNPFPSLLDVFYLAGYPLLILGLTGFVRAYAAAGYPMGSLRASALMVTGLVIAGIALVWPVLAGLAGPSPLLEKVLAAAYPLLDIALLVAVALLLRGARRFGGGRAWEVWALVLAGLGVMIAGDLRYAYFAAGGEENVDALSEIPFVIAYLLLALGALKQKELIET